MGKQISVNLIAKNGELCMKTIMFNCDDIVSGSPRLGWLTRQEGCCGTPYLYGVTTDQTKSDANSLAGVVVETKDGDQLLLDVATVDALRASCDSCCGIDYVPIVSTYNNTMPAFTAPASSTFCITRSDDGGAQAVQKAALDYMNKVDTFVHKSNNGAGVSKYQVTAISSPTPVGTDTVAAGACA